MVVADGETEAELRPVTSPTALSMLSEVAFETLQASWLEPPVLIEAGEAVKEEITGAACADTVTVTWALAFPPGPAAVSL